MRSILFFDLPSVTSEEQKAYRNFVKEIKKFGFYMIQESVYVKMTMDNQKCKAAVDKVRKIVPKKGSVMVMNVTEKQFAAMDILLGEFKSDVVESNQRMVIL